MKAEWEMINQTPNNITERMAIPGGWLVCRVNGSHLPQSLTSWLVQDPDHLWKVDNESKSAAE